MNIATFIEVVPTLPSDISIMVRGPHGVGKSQLFKQIADKLGLELIDRRLKDLTVDRHAEFWKGIDRAGAGYKYNSLIDVPAERWQETSIRLPEGLAGRTYRDVVTGQEHELPADLSLATVLAQLPFALLEAI